MNLLCSHFTFSQSLNYINYNTNNSKLPHDIVFGPHQDKAGYIWICTDDGLVRFDGMEMKIYDEGFVSKYVINADDDRDKLWISTWKGGVHYLKNDSIFLPNAEGDEGFSFNTNRIIASDNIIITYGFFNYMVFKYDEKRDVLKAIELELKPDGDPYCSTESKEYYHFVKVRSQGQLLAYNHTGIYKVIDGKLKLYKDVVRPDEIWESPQKKLYYRKGAKIYETDFTFSLSKLVYIIPFKQHKGQTLLNFQVLPSGNIYIGFLDSVQRDNLRCYLVNPATGETLDLLKEVGSASMSGWCMIDKEGGLWLSTDGTGLYHIFDKKYKFLGGEKIFKNAHITTLLADQKGKLYIGTKKGIYTYYKNNIHRINIPDTRSDYIKKIFLTPEGIIAASVKSAIMQAPPSYAISTALPKRLDYNEKYIYKSYSFTMGNASNELKDRSGINYALYPGLPVVIHDSEEGTEKKMWFGCNDGVYYFHPDSGIKKYKGIGNYIVNDLQFEEGKGMWVGTNNGLYLITPDMHYNKHWGINEGLSNLNVNCLYVQSPNSLWIGTQNGLFNLRDNRLNIYKKRDGLIADDIKCFARLSANELAIGSSKGISFLYINTPKEIHQSNRLMIEEILVNGKKQPFSNTIKMPYNSSVSINYNLITFVYPELVSFEYRLNKNDPWIGTQNKSLVLSNLQPGTYDIQIKAKKYNTGWGKPLLLSLTVIPLWYQTLWFKISLSVVLTLIIYILFRWRVNNIKKVEKEKTLYNKKINELEGNALANQMNPHFIFNSLNTVQQFILGKEEEQGLNYLNDFSLMIRQMLKYSRESTIDISEEIVFLQRYMELERIRFNKKFSFRFDIDPEIYHMDIKIPPMLIQPLLENAVKYGQTTEQAHVSMLMESSDTMLTVEIEDNGYGIRSTRNGSMKTSAKHESTALKVVESRLRLLHNIRGENGTIRIIDKSELDSSTSGTRIIIHIPLLN
jgi:ligand-binding sensor domain-containing protein